MIYLDTGCFVKLYYPEPDSARVIALIQGKAVGCTPLHELEFVNALQLKTFFKHATAQQVTAARGLVAADLRSGVLVSADGDWPDIFREAVKLAEQHTGMVGCRSLDILHCASTGSDRKAIFRRPRSPSARHRWPATASTLCSAASPASATGCKAPPTLWTGSP